MRRSRSRSRSSGIIILRRVAQVLSLSSLVVCVSAEPEPCEIGSNEVGYSSIAELNADMVAELTKIVDDGQDPQDAYTFNLCSDTEFDATDEPIRPILDNSFIMCGTDGSSSNGCKVTGGLTQVEMLVPSTDSQYEVSAVTIMGIQFEDFKNESISAYAAAPATLNFRDVQWTNFNSGIVINQAVNGTEEVDDDTAGAGAETMTVDISDSTVNTGTAGSVFDNDGGVLRISNLVVNEIDAASLIATANGGNSFLQDSKIDNSALDYVTTTTTTGAQSVINVEVSSMRRIEDAFVVADLGSMLSVTGTSIINNNNMDADPAAGGNIRWSGITAKQSATATVSTTTIKGNIGVEFAVSSIGSGSTLTITESSITENSGTNGPNRISASAIALSRATISLQRVQLNDNQGFSSSVQALLGGTVDIVQSCFEGGSADYVLFIDASSTYTVARNYINDYTSQQCPEGNPGGRLFKEEAGSGCFIGGNVCEGTCEVAADQAECLAEEVISPTASPKPVETDSPTTATPGVTPTAAPTTAGPGPTPDAAPTSAPTPTAPTKAPVTPSPTKPISSVKQPSHYSPPESAQDIPVVPMQDKPSEEVEVECDDEYYYHSKHGHYHHHKSKKGGKGSSSKCKHPKGKKRSPKESKGKGKSGVHHHHGHHGGMKMSGNTGHRIANYALHWDPTGKGYFVDTNGRTFEGKGDKNRRDRRRNQRFLRIYPQGEIVEEFLDEEEQIEEEAQMIDITR